jgi:CDGSH-type Zn-finger protein/uncharacterized Fe-S cluster protein YjdI
LNAVLSATSRERLLHALYEAAELEHNLMCTYLYAAFSLRDGVAEGLSEVEAAAVARWRRALMSVAIDEMGHLAAVWNITAGLGGSPRFGRGNFPLDPGALPAAVVLKLAPFSPAVLQHFVHMERPGKSAEPDGEGFTTDYKFTRSAARARLMPMGLDYDTVGDFYQVLADKLRLFATTRGEAVAFCGDPQLQLSPAEIELNGAKPVICLKTALAAIAAIVEQGEGASLDSSDSHYQRFIAVRSEYAALRAANPAFEAAFPAATNPVQRVPVRSSGRVWIEDEDAAATVDIANTGYALMLRLIAYSYALRRPDSEKALAVDLGMGLMRAVTVLGERAARLPAGPASPGCNAGVSFAVPRDAAPFPPGPAARRFFTERLEELADAARALRQQDEPRVQKAVQILEQLSAQAARAFAAVSAADQAVAGAAPGPQSPPAPAVAPPAPVRSGEVDAIEGRDMTLLYEGRKCIHSRFCVTGAPRVFLANVQGPWIHPDAMPVERLVDIAHLCPSGAIRYRRKDSQPDETAPPVNLVAIREGGPYAIRGDLRLNGESIEFRATLCRCGASKNKPFCDGSHHEVNFAASGEPATVAGKTDMLAVRDGPLAVDPQLDGPLRVRGNIEITSGTGRVVARLTQATLCRCGASNNKPFCDGSHARVGFRS